MWGEVWGAWPGEDQVTLQVSSYTELSLLTGKKVGKVG